MTRPGPILGRALRLPAHLYDIGAGRLLGHRFLLVTHRGRRSGRLYRTMLEVVRWDPEKQEAIVMSGFGQRSNWLLNVLAGGAVEVRIAATRFEPAVRSPEREEAVRVLADYERRNRLAGPIVRAVLSRLAGFRYDGSAAARYRLVEALPLVAFNPRNGGEKTLSVRRMLRDELEAAVSVWRAANAARGAPHGTERTARIREKLSAPDALAFVALRPEIVGMALAEPGRLDEGAGGLDPTLLHISMVFVHPATQRTGVGSSLVLHVLDAARSLGYQRAGVWTYRDNAFARRLYEGAGMTTTGKTARVLTRTQIQYGCLLGGKGTP